MEPRGISIFSNVSLEGEFCSKLQKPSLYSWGHANAQTDHVIMVNWKSVKLEQSASAHSNCYDPHKNSSIWDWMECFGFGHFLSYQKILMYEAHKKASPLCYCQISDDVKVFSWWVSIFQNRQNTSVTRIKRL